ncbi:Abortive infection bacteriophage resistance protein [Arcticibacter svalbardensis MN12-7]|uniref:Abortive infection bacteriophage resistance protein n=1 Tax=Arcticibacter svalbardensis MN12-7 TaxID=1150600 RepID=R9H4T1_9SPHI|nr:Abi family protein [Arcticibacter svalbardensis]EOR96154.1 Abortive infection bacteriophage resistance protein [Arcticibacter svalbardensis MN12-7]
MSRIPYHKPALSYQVQLQQLKDRGLKIEDDSKALFLLENISYYRLSGYWYPMIQAPKSTHLFKKDASFDLAFQLYCFDRELRKLVGAELEKIEVAIRAKMIYLLSHEYGPNWLNNTGIFKNSVSLNQTIIKLKKDFERSDEQFIKSFKENYNDPLPPSWMILEISSFGTLSSLYKNLKPNRKKREISKYFGLDDSTFESWLHTIVYVRNVCAHHSRLWNRSMRITPSLPITPTNSWLSVVDIEINGTTKPINNKTYFVLSMIIYLLNTVSPNNKFKQRLFNLLDRYSVVDLSAMGFSGSWQTEIIWKFNRDQIV